MRSQRIFQISNIFHHCIFLSFMKSEFLSLLFVALAAPVYAGEGLYNTGAELVEGLPLKWSLSTNTIYDDNVAAGSSTTADSSLAISPNLGLSYTSDDPQSSQTTIDILGKIGIIHYFDAPDTLADDTFSQSRISGSLNHRFDERLTFRSQNTMANELEPDYSYGTASSRSGNESLSWLTDNSLGYRWSERYATYTGVKYSGNRVDSTGPNNNDRTTIEGYNQIRYQLSQQSVLTSDYRASTTDATGVASDSVDQYFLVGVDHRFSSSTVGIFKTGAQYREVDQGDGGLGPYLEIAFKSQVNQQLTLNAFTRYSAEVNDTVLPGPGTSFDYEDRRALRIGSTASYIVSPDLSLLSGMDLIFSDYLEGRDVSNPTTYGPDRYETSVNAYVGFSCRLTEFLTANMYYTFAETYTDISAAREYVRNRISIGLSAEF
jgi:hypothetical protein